MLSSLELARVQTQLERHDWYRHSYEGFKKGVDELVDRNPAIPVRKGRAFYESCPDDNAVLIFDPYAPEHHVCSKCGKDWQGDKFGGGWVRQFQEWLAKRLIETGIVYRLTGSELYADYIRRVLHHFVRHYKDYPLASNLLGPTRLFQSTYLEAFWLTDMVTAFDLVREAACFTGQDHEAVRELFYQSCAVIKSFDEKRSNRQAFNNVAIGAVGLLYDDKELVEHALNGPHGFSFHMANSLLEDGLWYEGENYHFATLHHLLNLAELARHRDIDLYGGQSGYGALKPMFYGPLQVMYPDLTFPARKDGWFGRGIAYHKEIYELGYIRYGDERLGGLLAQAYQSGGGREALSWRGFLYLEPELPAQGQQTLRPQGCEEMPGTGVAVLRSDGGATYASLEYGHYGGGHGHPDRLHLSFFAADQPWFLDPGTGWYHVPELGWYRSTLAHNTVTVDGLSQRPREGRLSAFGSAAGFKVAQAQVEEAYPDVTMRRTLCLGPGYLLDVFDLLSDEEHTYDWVLHSRADLVLSGSTTAREAAHAELGERNGYEFLQAVQHLEPVQLEAELQCGEDRLHLLQLGTSQFYRARSLGIPLQEEISFTSLIARRQARHTRYVSCYLYGSNVGGDSSGVVRLEGLKPDLYALHLNGETHSFQLDETDGLAVTVAREGKLQTLAWFGKRQVVFPGVAVSCERSLPQASLRREGSSWSADLPADFGWLRLDGLGADILLPDVQDLPEGASWQAAAGGLELTQPLGSHVWLPEGETQPTFFAGCENRLRFHVGVYGSSPREVTPGLELPDSWQLVHLEQIHEKSVTTWEATLRLPPQRQAREGKLVITVADTPTSLEYKIRSPLATEWAVTSTDGRPQISLQIRELRGQGGCVQVEVAAPWLIGNPRSFATELEAHGIATVRLPLSLVPVPASGSKNTVRPSTKDAVDEMSRPAETGWELPGTADSAGAYGLVATVQLDEFAGVSRARLPLYWSLPRSEAQGTPLMLNRPEQAFWAETPWQSEQDASAVGLLHWDEHGLYLRCEVDDDLHISDANEDDLYENDSLQVYFDFRPNHHRDHNFTRGVAAYTLAPDQARQELRLEPIAGNREISNRGARANWYTSEGVEATVKPTTTGYRIEAFFPYRSLGVGPLEPGDVIGLDLALSDNDGTWYRKLQLMWSGARGRRSYIRGSYHNPREFGYLIAARREPAGQPAEADTRTGAKTGRLP